MLESDHHTAHQQRSLTEQLKKLEIEQKAMKVETISLEKLLDGLEKKSKEAAIGTRRSIKATEQLEEQLKRLQHHSHDKEK
jgi:predicted ATPase